MHDIANELRSIAKNAVNASEVNELVKAILTKAKGEAESGRTHMSVRLVGESCKTLFEFNQYNKDDALHRAVKTALVNQGLDFEFMYGVNGLYAVIMWG
jgi:hypothetical protein